MEKISGKKWHLPQLDVIRWWAFLAVYVTHAFPGYKSMPGYPEALQVVVSRLSQSFAFGVDLFFALSSFLLTTLLVRERNLTGTVNIRAFYWRRSLRILPPYYGILLFCFLFQNILAVDHISWELVISFAFMVGNWTMYSAGWTPFISHLWSVCLEEQFYLFCAPTIKWLGSKRLPLVATAMLVLSPLVRYVIGLGPKDVSLIWLNSFARLDSLAVGVLVATTFAETTIKRRKTAISLSILALFIAGLIWPSKEVGTANRILGYLVPAICCGVIIKAAVSIPITSLSRGRVFSKLEYLGKISYGLYLFHVLGLLLGKHFLPGRTPGRVLIHAALGLGITIALANLSYPAERWFLRQKENLPWARRQLPEIRTAQSMVP